MLLTEATTKQHNCTYKSKAAVIQNCYFQFLWPLAALWNRTGHYICAMWFLLLSSFFFSPNLSGHRVDVYQVTSTHGVALVRI